MISLSELRDAEAVLASQLPFGDGEYIHVQMQRCYLRRLRKVSQGMPVCADLADALDAGSPNLRYFVLGDTVMRAAIQHRMKQLDTGEPYGFLASECEAIFSEALVHIRRGRTEWPLWSGFSERSRLTTISHPGWVWREDHADDLYGRCFRQLIKENYRDPLHTPAPRDVELLDKGAQLLNELAPLLSRSAFHHAPMIVIFAPEGFWARRASSSQFRISGTIFLNRELLGNPWWVAEHLLHESLHHKLYDFRHGHSLLAPDYARPEAPRICSIWNEPGSNSANCWDTHRSIAAFHVYVHLALLCAIAETRAPELEEQYGSLSRGHAMTSRHKCVERALYLGENLKAIAWSELGAAGKSLVTWLMDILQCIAPAPSSTGAYLSLLLDRYKREADNIANLTGTSGAGYGEGVPVESCLERLLQREVDIASQVVERVGGHDDAAIIRANMTPASDEPVQRRFHRVRNLIARTLLEHSDGGARLARTPEDAQRLDVLVRGMIDHASLQLAAIASD